MLHSAREKMLLKLKQEKSALELRKLYRKASSVAKLCSLNV